MTTARRDGGSRDGPTVLRILLGSRLRELREARGISREVAGHAIRASGSKISRMERGRVGFKGRDVADLLYMEYLTSALYLDKREDVDHYATAMELLCVEAEPVSRTREILVKALREYGG